MEGLSLVFVITDTFRIMLYVIIINKFIMDFKTNSLRMALSIIPGA